MRVMMPVNGVYNKRIKCPGPTGEFQINPAALIAPAVNWSFKPATQCCAADS